MIGDRGDGGLGERLVVAVVLAYPVDGDEGDGEGDRAGQEVD